MSERITPDEAQSLQQALTLHADAVYRLLRIRLREQADVDDAFQEVFLKLMRAHPDFENETHRRAWLLRTAINQSHDMYRNVWRRRVSSLEDMEIPVEDEKESAVMDAILKLPPRLRELVHLHYYEGYSILELSRMLDRKENTLYSDLHRARKRLRVWLEEDVEV